MKYHTFDLDKMALGKFFLVKKQEDFLFSHEKNTYIQCHPFQWTKDFFHLRFDVIPMKKK